LFSPFAGDIIQRNGGVNVENFMMEPARIPAEKRRDMLERYNDRSARYGLTLSEAGLARLLEERGDALRQTGRLEVGEGILPRLIDTFRSSPYLLSGNYEETLSQLQELFYQLKNECQDLVSDQELVDAMALIFNEAAQGSVDFLADLDWRTVYRVAVTGRLEGTGIGIDGGDDGE